MNEIIAKLYDQAIVIEDGGDYVCGELDPVKFAELIIKDQQRTWVGLTDDEIIEWVESGEYNVITNDWASHIDFARAIEAQLKERNT